MNIPIPTIHLFQTLDQKLIELLRVLTDEDWAKPALAKQWFVKDIAAHLLDGNLRTLSMLRDRYFGVRPNESEAIVPYLNRLNAEWVTSFKRISPAVLVDMLESSGKEYYHYLSGLDPFAISVFSVGWAGEQESKNWFHIAREYTEKWHHQQQIREAVGVDGIMNPELFSPVIKTFMMALPYTYRDVAAVEGTILETIITGESGGKWAIQYSNKVWSFTSVERKPSSIVEINQQDAWKLFTKGISLNEAEKRISIKGDTSLGKQILNMVSVMA